MACHTEDRKDALPFAGGRALKTPFGIFYGPNITPHPEGGIGRWSEADFMRAMRLGERPDGAHYFPAFPYPSFTRISDSDLRDLWAFLRTLAPSSRANQEHDLRFPFGLRILVTGWKWLFFTPGPLANDSRRTPVVNRGAYLVEALGHCGECHTPRNFLGGPNRDRLLAGSKTGPDGKRVPNLTPAKLKKWDDAELKEFLQTGLTPDGDVAAETMGEVIRNTTSQLTPEDLAAVVAYLRALPPLADEPK
jgi:mono/diheme cytochrome c family protein